MSSSKGRAVLLLALLVFLVSSQTHAARIAFYSSTQTDAVLANTGHFTSQVSLTAIELGALVTFDILVLGHVDVSGWSQAACNRVEEFVLGGGGLVTEWNGATILFQNAGGSLFFPISPRCNWFAGTIDDGSSTLQPTFMNTLSNNHPLTVGLPTTLDLHEGSEFYYKITGYSGSWSVGATYGSGWPALMHSAFGSGCVVVGVTDYFDVLGFSPLADTMMDNMLNVSMSCVAPSLPPPLFSDSFEGGTTGSWD